MDIGSVVWLNSGQGPWTVVTINTDEAYIICTDGISNRQFPTACVSESPTQPGINQQVATATNNLAQANTQPVTALTS